MILSRIFPGEFETIDLEDATSRARLLELYTPPSTTWLRLNLVVTVNGSAAGADGTSESLTNPADRRILGVIRELSDVILVGAKSVRSEGYVMPRRAPLAVLTASGDLEGHRIGPSLEAGRLIVLCPATAVDRVAESLGETSADVILLEGDENGLVDVTDALAALRDRGFASIVCEGGPSLAAQLAKAAQLDEVCLTTSPTLGGEPLPLLPTHIGEPRALRLEQLLVDDASALYARWLLA